MPERTLPMLLAITMIIFQGNNVAEDRTGIDVSSHAIAQEAGNGARAEYYQLCLTDDSCCLEHVYAEGE